VAAIGAALSGGNVGGAVVGSLGGDALQSLAQPIINQAVSQLPADAQDAARNALNDIVATAGGALGGALAGSGSQGSITGAGSAANNEVYNRQIHDEDQLTGESGSSSPFSQSPLVLVWQSIANGLNAIMGMTGGEPPVAPGTSMVDSATGEAVNVAPGTPGYVPSNATFNSGGDDAGDSASSPSSGNATDSTDTAATGRRCRQTFSLSQIPDRVRLFHPTGPLSRAGHREVPFTILLEPTPALRKHIHPGDATRVHARAGA
jgi:hypothetical protein